MTFSIFRNFWRCAIRQACMPDFQRFYRRSANGRAVRRFRLFVKSSMVYTAFRYGFCATSSLSLSAVVLTADVDQKKNLSRLKSFSNGNDSQHQQSESKQRDVSDFSDSTEKWDNIYEDENIKVFRRYRAELGGIYEYRCTGTYNDITPLNFVATQNDVDYRRKWDENVISLEVLDEDEESDVQVISWVARYPYPMYAREYIYTCRKFVDDDAGTIVIENFAVDPSERSSTSKYVRVTRYKSRLVVCAHSTLNEKGLDYTLTYYDDPKSSIPTMAYNWIVHQGGPYFMKKIYQAALERERIVDAEEEADYERRRAKKARQPQPTDGPAEATDSAESTTTADAKFMKEGP